MNLRERKNDLRLAISNVLKENKIDDLRLEIELTTAIIELLDDSVVERKGTEQALADGIAGEQSLKSLVENLFSIYPNWERKDWSNLLFFLKERPDEESLNRFASWWKSEDWRGKTGQPPNAGQIMEVTLSSVA